MSKEKKNLLEPISEVIGELTLDSQLTEGFLKEIPVVKTIWTFYKAGRSLQEHFYLKKLQLFLENIKDIKESEFQEFFNEVENDKAKLSDSLLLILDKIEDETKAILIANAFKVYVKEKFSFETFNRILLVINRGFCQDLLNIIIFEQHKTLLTNGKHISEESLNELYSCGLLKNQDIDAGNDEDDGGYVYSLNQYGEIFLRIVKEMKNFT